MLDFQLQQAALSFGLAEGVDPHQVPFGTLMTAENCRWTKQGRLEKRCGTAALAQNIAGGGLIQSATRIFTRGAELCLVDQQNLYGYAPGTSTWALKGRVPNLAVTWESALDSIAGIKACDMAYLSDGRIVQAWVNGATTDPTTTGTVYYQINDAVSGAVITPPTQLGGGAHRIRVVATGTSYVIVWVAGALLRCFSGGSTTTIQTGVSNVTAQRGSFDTCIVGTDWVVGYALLAGGISLRRYDFASPPNLLASGAVTGEASTNISALAIEGTLFEKVYVGYVDQTTPKFRYSVHDPATLAVTSGPTDLLVSATVKEPAITIKRINASSAAYVYSYQGVAPAVDCLLTIRSVSSTGALGAAQTSDFLRVVSKPFYLGVDPKLHVAVSTATAAALVNSGAGVDTFLVEVTPGLDTAPVRQVAKTASLSGGFWVTGYVSSIMVMPLGVAVPVPVQSRGWALQGVDLVMVSTDSTDRFRDDARALPFGPETCISGGFLTAYDGAEALGYGFPHASLLNTAQTVPGIAGSLATGAYLYNLVPERRSRAGVLHRGPTGINFLVNVTGPLGVTVAATAIDLAYSAYSQSLIAVYRTIVAGSIPQRLTVEPVTAYLLNNHVAGSPLTVADTQDDGSAALATKPAIYTASGELDDFQPTASLTMATHQNRLWLVHGDGFTVGFSKDAALNPGTAPGFNPTQVLTFEERVVALQSMDDKLIAFGENTFWVVVGQGPAPNGQGATYEIQNVQTDVGCVNPRSVVSTPNGIIFESARGLYMLTRDLGLDWIGRPVKDQLAAYPNITSAVLVPSRNEIRFTTTNAIYTRSQVLSYNYVEKQWTTAIYWAGGVYGGAISDACMWNGAWTFVSTGGTVYVESTTTFLDNGLYVPMTIETAWVTAAGPLAFQSVRNFAAEGIAQSHHNLTVQVGFDTDPAYPQTRTFLAGSPVTSPGPFESLEISIGTRRKCQAIRFRITDAAPTGFALGTGQGPAFDMIGIQVGVKRGFRTKAVGRTG